MSDRTPFRKHVRYATTTAYNRAGQEITVNVVATITWDGSRLSIVGVEGAKANGDCYGSCGQVRVQEDHQPVAGIDLVKFGQVWDRWHLNDMQAGTPKQEAWFRENGHTPHHEGGYVKDCERLEAAGLLIDNGYKYSTKWLKEEVPDEVLDYLRSLPETTELPEQQEYTKAYERALARAKASAKFPKAKKIEVEEPFEPYVLTGDLDMSWPKDFEEQFKEHNSKDK